VIQARTSFSSCIAIVLLLGSAPAWGQHTPGIPGWQQDVHYRMSVSYSPQKFEIAGQETLAYWNLSPDSLTELYFHLYLNAYRPGSNMARHDASEENWRIQSLPTGRRGGEWIDRARILGGDSLHVFVDDTIARIPLPEVLAPGESVVVCLGFRSKIPDVPSAWGDRAKACSRRSGTPGYARTTGSAGTRSSTWARSSTAISGPSMSESRSRGTSCSRIPGRS